MYIYITNHTCIHIHTLTCIGTIHSTQSVFETSNEVFVPQDLTMFQQQYNLTMQQPMWHDNGGVISNETCFNRKFM